MFISLCKRQITFTNVSIKYYKSNFFQNKMKNFDYFI